MGGSESHIFKPVHFSAFSKFIKVSKDDAIYSYSLQAIISMRDSETKKP